MPGLRSLVARRRSSLASPTYSASAYIPPPSPASTPDGVRDSENQDTKKAEESDEPVVETSENVSNEDLNLPETPISNHEDIADKERLDKDGTEVQQCVEEDDKETELPGVPRPYYEIPPQSEVEAAVENSRISSQCDVEERVKENCKEEHWRVEKVDQEENIKSVEQTVEEGKSRQLVEKGDTDTGEHEETAYRIENIDPEEVDHRVENFDVEKIPLPFIKKDSDEADRRLENVDTKIENHHSVEEIDQKVGGCIREENIDQEKETCQTVEDIYQVVEAPQNLEGVSGEGVQVQGKEVRIDANDKEEAYRSPENQNILENDFDKEIPHQSVVTEEKEIYKAGLKQVYQENQEPPVVNRGDFRKSESYGVNEERDVSETTGLDNLGSSHSRTNDPDHSKVSLTAKPKIKNGLTNGTGPISTGDAVSRETLSKPAKKSASMEIESSLAKRGVTIVRRIIDGAETSGGPKTTVDFPQTKKNSVITANPQVTKGPLDFQQSGLPTQFSSKASAVPPDYRGMIANVSQSRLHSSPYSVKPPSRISPSLPATLPQHLTKGYFGSTNPKKFTAHSDYMQTTSRGFSALPNVKGNSLSERVPNAISNTKRNSVDGYGKGIVAPSDIHGSLVPNARGSLNYNNSSSMAQTPQVRPHTSPSTTRISPSQPSALSAPLRSVGLPPQSRTPQPSPQSRPLEMSPQCRSVDASPKSLPSELSPMARNSEMSPCSRRTGVSPQSRSSEISPLSTSAEVSPQIRSEISSQSRPGEISSMVESASLSPQSNTVGIPSQTKYDRVPSQTLPLEMSSQSRPAGLIPHTSATEIPLQSSNSQLPPNSLPIGMPTLSVSAAQTQSSSIGSQSSSLGFLSQSNSMGLSQCMTGDVSHLSARGFSTPTTTSYLERSSTDSFPLYNSTVPFPPHSNSAGFPTPLASGGFNMHSTPGSFGSQNLVGFPSQGNPCEFPHHNSTEFSSHGNSSGIRGHSNPLGFTSHPNLGGFPAQMNPGVYPPHPVSGSYNAHSNSSEFRGSNNDMLSFPSGRDFTLHAGSREYPSYNSSTQHSREMNVNNPTRGLPIQNCNQGVPLHSSSAEPHLNSVLREAHTNLSFGDPMVHPNYRDSSLLSRPTSGDLSLSSDFRESALRHNYRESSVPHNYRHDPLHNNFREPVAQNPSSHVSHSSYRDLPLLPSISTIPTQSGSQGSSINSTCKERSLPSNYREQDVLGNFLESSVLPSFRETLDHSSRREQPLPSFRETVDRPSPRGQSATSFPDPSLPSHASPREQILSNFQESPNLSSPRENTLPGFRETVDHASPREQVLPNFQTSLSHSSPREQVYPAFRETLDHSIPREQVLPSIRSTAPYSSSREQALPNFQDAVGHSSPKEQILPSFRETTNHTSPRERLSSFREPLEYGSYRDPLEHNGINAHPKEGMNYSSNYNEPLDQTQSADQSMHNSYRDLHLASSVGSQSLHEVSPESGVDMKFKSPSDSTGYSDTTVLPSFTESFDHSSPNEIHRADSAVGFSHPQEPSFYTCSRNPTTYSNFGESYLPSISKESPEESNTLHSPIDIHTSGPVNPVSQESVQSNVEGSPDYTKEKRGSVCTNPIVSPRSNTNDSVINSSGSISPAYSCTRNSPSSSRAHDSSRQFGPLESLSSTHAKEDFTHSWVKDSIHHSSLENRLEEENPSDTYPDTCNLADSPTKVELRNSDINEDNLDVAVSQRSQENLEVLNEGETIVKTDLEQEGTAHVSEDVKPSCPFISAPSLLDSSKSSEQISPQISPVRSPESVSSVECSEPAANSHNKPNVVASPGSQERIVIKMKLLPCESRPDNHKGGENSGCSENGIDHRNSMGKYTRWTIDSIINGREMCSDDGSGKVSKEKESDYDHRESDSYQETRNSNKSSKKSKKRKSPELCSDSKETKLDTNKNFMNKPLRITIANPLKTRVSEESKTTFAKVEKREVIDDIPLEIDDDLGEMNSKIKEDDEDFFGNNRVTRRRTRSENEPERKPVYNTRRLRSRTLNPSVTPAISDVCDSSKYTAPPVVCTHMERPTKVESAAKVGSPTKVESPTKEGRLQGTSMLNVHSDISVAAQIKNCSIVIKRIYTADNNSCYSSSLCDKDNIESVAKLKVPIGKEVKRGDPIKPKTMQRGSVKPEVKLKCVKTEMKDEDFVKTEVTSESLKMKGKVRRQTNVEPEVKQPITAKPEGEEPYIIKSEVKQLDSAEVEVKQPDANSKVKQSTAAEPEVKQTVMQPDTDEPEKQQDIAESEVKKPDTAKPEGKQHNTTKCKVKQPDTTKPEVKRRRTVRTEVKQQALKSEAKHPSIVRTEVKCKNTVEREVKQEDSLKREVKQQRGRPKRKAAVEASERCHKSIKSLDTSEPTVNKVPYNGIFVKIKSLLPEKVEGNRNQSLQNSIPKCSVILHDVFMNRRIDKMVCPGCSRHYNSSDSVQVNITKGTISLLCSACRWLVIKDAHPHEVEAMAPS